METLTASELKARLDAGEDLAVIDVRNAWELEISQLSFAQHVALDELPQRLDDIPQDKPVVLVCRSGGRSFQAGMFLISQGWENVINLEGGILGWAKDVDPSLPTNY